jgi:Domain of unknown function (DUF222)
VRASYPQLRFHPQVVVAVGFGGGPMSLPIDTFRCMFDDLDRCDDAGLLRTMGESLRAERVQIARRLVSAGLFIERRIATSMADTQFWAVDDWDVAAAEIGAELGISRHRASADMDYGQTLVTRFPKLAERCLAGEVDFRVVAVIDFRTALVSDPELHARLDVILARLAPGWNSLSKKKLIELIDWQVIQLEPEAQRMPAERNAERCIEITPGHDGMAELSGRLDAIKGAALDKRLDQLASSVCREDPRTKVQRRVDAFIALTEGAPFACGCGSEDCPATTTDADGAGRSEVVVHVVAEQSTVDGTGTKPGHVRGYGPVPADVVHDVAKTAKLKPLVIPTDAVPESGYRPSAALADFIDSRDLTCRWPGCDAPAERCDVDHTVPHPHGPTHPSNNKLFCRHHHLMKTFWTGPDGFTDRQDPDGTVTITSPSGRSHESTPLGARFFPQLATPTGDVQTSERPPPANGAARRLKMPRRARTRAAARTARIARERALRRAHIEANPPPF